MNKRKGIFEKWFSDFAMAVFTQSLHAIMLTFLLLTIAAIMAGGASEDEDGTKVEVSKVAGIDFSDEDNKTPGIIVENGDEDGKPDPISAAALAPLVSLVTFFGVTGITRFEKSVKQIFGIGESSFLKGTRENAAKTSMAIRSGINMARNTTKAASEGIKGLKTKARMSANLKEMEKKGLVEKRGNYYAATGKTGVEELDGASNSTEMISSNSAAGVANNSKANIRNVNKSVLENERQNIIAERDRLNKEVDELTSKINNGRIPSSALPQARRVRAEMQDNANNLELRVQDIERQLANIGRNNAVQARINQTISAQTIDTNQAINSGTNGNNQQTENSNNNGANEGFVPKNDYEKLKYENEQARKAERLQNRLEKEQDKIQKQVDEYNKANRDVIKAIPDSIFNIGATAAGLGVGAGMDNDLSDIVNIGNAISSPFVHMSTDKLIRHQNKKIQQAMYKVASEYGGDEAVIKMSAKISPEFVNDGSITSAIIGGIEKKVKGVSKNIKLDNTKIKATQNVDVDVQTNVNINSTQNVVNNVKNTKNTTLKSLKSSRKGLKFQSNVDRENYINSVDDI